MASNNAESLQEDHDKLVADIKKTTTLIRGQTSIIKVLIEKINTSEALFEEKDERINTLLLEVEEKNVQIKTLLLEIERLKNSNNKDSSNSSIPSSKNGFKKVKNSREKSDKKQGGQNGHKGTTLDVSRVKELIDSGKAKREIFEINKNPNNQNKDYIVRYVQDIEISTVIKEYRYYPDENGSFNIPKEQTNTVVYGNGIKAISMLLVHKIPASMDQSVMFLNTITNGAFAVTKSTLANWSRALSGKLDLLIDEIKEGLLGSYYVNTDESPINVNGKNYQLHNYSNQKYTLQYLHKNKSKAAIMALDFLANYRGILIHDHNKVIYNFGTKHGECNTHILRYLAGVEDFTNHKWPLEMKTLLTEILHQKHILINENVFSFDEKTMESYSQKYDDILEIASKEYQTDHDANAYRDEERRLFTRLKEYKDNHLLFMRDFEIPFTNNQAESDIRPVKRKLNVGIFREVSGGEYYLRIRSFISTFLKNNLDIFEAMKNGFDNKVISLNMG